MSHAQGIGNARSDLERLDSTLTETMWMTVSDRSVPFDVMASRAIDALDAFLYIAEGVREMTRLTFNRRRRNQIGDSIERFDRFSEATLHALFDVSPL